MLRFRIRFMASFRIAFRLLMFLVLVIAHEVILHGNTYIYHKNYVNLSNIGVLARPIYVHRLELWMQAMQESSHIVIAAAHPLKFLPVNGPMFGQRLLKLALILFQPFKRGQMAAEPKGKPDDAH